MLDARISVINLDQDPLWNNYDIKSERGVATINIRVSLRQTIRRILRIPRNEKLEGTVVRAYYSCRSLVGFTPHVDE